MSGSVGYAVYSYRALDRVSAKRSMTSGTARFSKAATAASSSPPARSASSRTASRIIPRRSSCARSALLDRRCGRVGTRAGTGDAEAGAGAEAGSAGAGAEVGGVGGVGGTAGAVGWHIAPEWSGRPSVDW